MRIMRRRRSRNKVAKQLDDLRGISRQQLEELRGISRKQLQELRAASRSAMERMHREKEQAKPAKKKKRRPSLKRKLLTYAVASGAGVWIVRAMKDDKPQGTT